MNFTANYQQIMHKMPPTITNVRSRLPVAPTEEQRPIRTLTVHVLMKL